MKKLYAVILTAVVFTSLISAEDIKEGRMKLTMHESSGRISVFYQNELVTDKYTSLLLKQDPRTSGITLLVDNKTYKLGDSYEFEQSIEPTKTGSSFIWTSKQLKITEAFSFVTSKNSSIADGVRIDITINNISETALSVGLKYLFDTWLGEKNKSNRHFRNPDYTYISGEKVYKGLMPDYWVSIDEDTPDIGLLVMLDNKVVTQPDQVIFANWKRLDESGWTLNTKDDRNFNLLPYSINDSAVAHYYAPVRIPSGSSRTITLVLGNYSESGFEVKTAAANSNLDDLYNRVSTDDSTESFTSTENAIKNELVLTDDLIIHINRLLNSDEPLTEDELNTLNIMIQALEKNKENFEE